MAKIQEYLPQRSIQPGQRVSTGNGDALAQAGNRLGQTLEGIGQRIQEREDRLNYVKAKSQFNQRKIEADNAFYDDNDYKTFVPRYSEAMKVAKQEAINAIRHPDMKAEFEAQVDVDITSGVQRTAQLSWMREKEYGQGQLEGILTQNREAFLRAPSEQARASVIQNDLEAINTAEELSYLPADDAERLRIKRTEDLASAYLDTKPPNERLLLLQEKGGYAEYIPKDKRQAMEEKTKAEITSQALLAERNRKIQSARNHIEALNSVEENDGVIDLPSDVWNSFDSGQRNSLIAYGEKISSGELIGTDWNRYYELMQMAQTDPAGFSQLDLGSDRNNLGNAEFKKMIDLQGRVIDDKSNDLVFNILTDKSAMDNALYSVLGKKPAKYNEDDKIYSNAFYRIANQEMQQWLRENPNYKKVPDVERAAIIDKLTEKMYTKQGSLFGIDVLWPDADATLIEEIVSDLEESGKPVNSYSIFKTYQNAKKAGVIE